MQSLLLQDLGTWQGWIHLFLVSLLILAKSDKWEFLKGLLKFNVTILTSTVPIQSQHKFTLEGTI